MISSSSPLASLASMASRFWMQAVWKVVQPARYLLERTIHVDQLDTLLGGHVARGPSRRRGHGRAAPEAEADDALFSEGLVGAVHGMEVDVEISGECPDRRELGADR